MPMKSALAGLLLAALVFGAAAWRTQPPRPGNTTQTLTIPLQTPVRIENTTTR